MTATVCSKWALRLRSLLMTVHLSLSVSVRQVPDLHHRFDGYDQAGLQFNLAVDIVRHIVQYLRPLVHRPTDAVPGVFPHDVKSRSAPHFSAPLR